MDIGNASYASIGKSDPFSGLLRGIWTHNAVKPRKLLQVFEDKEKPPLAERLGLDRLYAAQSAAGAKESKW